MKIYRPAPLSAALLGLASLFALGCSDKAPPPAPPSVKASAPAQPVAAVPATTPVRPETHAVLVNNGNPAAWSDIKDYTFDQRAQFFTGLAQLTAQVDAQIEELTARRTTLVGTTSSADWDFAMKEMANARTYLRGMGEELVWTTAGNWDQKKEKVGHAWVRTQEAYAKVKASTTQ